MHLDKFSTGETNNASGLVTVKNNLAILLLKCKSYTFGNHKCDDRTENQERLEGVDDALHGDLEVSCNEVRRRCRPKNCVEGHSGCANCGTHRSVTRTVEQVVLTLVTGDPRLNEGVREGESQEDEQNENRNDDVPRPGVAKPVGLQVRGNQTKSTIGKTDIPVRLGTSRNRGGVVRSIVPDRVDRDRRSNKSNDTEYDEEEPTSLGCINRKHGETDDVLLGLTGARVLRVLVNDHKHQVHRDEDQNHRREQQDVQRVQATNNVAARELATKEEEGDPRTNDRYSQNHSVDDAETVTRE